MANQLSKKYILDKLISKAKAKGFKVDIKDKPYDGYVGIKEQLEIIAETIYEVFSEETDSIIIKGNSVKLGPSGLQKDVAYKDATVKADMTTDPNFFSWIESFHALLQSVYPEPGNGSPNVFATALKVLISQKPTSLTAKITDGSSKVKITI